MWKWAPWKRTRRDRAGDSTLAPDPAAQTDDPVCAACGKPLSWAGPPTEENGRPICAECDAANNFDVLE